MANLSDTSTHYPELEVYQHANKSEKLAMQAAFQEFKAIDPLMLVHQVHFLHSSSSSFSSA